MKVAFCLFKYFPYGGLQRDFYRIAAVCHSRGYDVIVYTLSWESEIPSWLRLKIVPVKALRNHLLDQKFYRWVKSDLDQNPVDCIFGMNKMQGLDIYYAADSCYIAKSHEQRGALYRLGARYKHFVASERAVFGDASNTQILLISETEKNKFIHYYGTAESRLTLLPPGISPDRRVANNSGLERARIRQKHHLSEDDKLILFIGSGFIKKGLDRAFYALAALPNDLKNKTHLFIIGKDKVQRFKKLAIKLGIADRVVFLGGSDEVPSYMQAGDLLLHPAYDEAAGIVLVESIVAGLPALVTANCGYAQHIAKADSGIVLPSPFSQQALNNNLLKMLTSANCSQWRNNGLRYAASEDLYSLPEKAVDAIEHFVGGSATWKP